MEITAENANALIQNRRSIYPNMFSGDEIPDHAIRQMLENANWAPNHKHTEPWRFIVYKGEGIGKLAAFQAGLYQEKATQAGTFSEEKHQKLLHKPSMCSHIIAIGMHRDPKGSVPEIEEICAVAAAVQNLWITASALNIGGYWSTGGITFYEEAKPFFGLGQDDKLLGFMMLGMPKGKWPQGKRKPIDDKVVWVA